ncbi:MAG: hypothetical protein ACODAU_07795 [Myxococcota bacterium]
MGRLRLVAICMVFGGVAVWAGCGGSEDDTGNDGGGVPDATTQEDAATGDADTPGLCGGEVCTDAEQCCITPSGSSCIPADDTCDPGSSCVGPDDCDAGQECCFHEGVFGCVEEGMCGGTLIECGSTSECTGGEVCCGVTTVSCRALDDCEGSPVRCTMDAECTDTGAGNCCSANDLCAPSCPE